MASNVVTLHDVQQATDSGYANVAPLINFMKQHGLTQAEVARRLDVSPTMVNLYLKYKYDQGDLPALNAAVADFLSAETTYLKYKPNITGVALTTQYCECLSAIQYVERHKSFGVIVGEAGLGKTEAFREYARQHRTSAILLVMDPTKKTKTAFIQHLWCKLPGYTRGTRRTLPKAALLIDDIISYFKDRHKVVLIDEAQFLSMESLECARSIQDQTGIGFVLGGTFDLDHDIGFTGVPANAQLFSRVKVHCVLKPVITKADIGEILHLWQVHDAAVIDWLFARCNYPGRRYRWMHAILSAAYDACIDNQAPFDVSALQQAEGLTGLTV